MPYGKGGAGGGVGPRTLRTTPAPPRAPLPGGDRGPARALTLGASLGFGGGVGLGMQPSTTKIPLSTSRPLHVPCGTLKVIVPRTWFTTGFKAETPPQGPPPLMLY